MRISRSGRTSDVFGEELKKIADKMPGSDKLIDQRLKEQRGKRDHAHEPGTEENILASDRKNEDTIGQQLTEKNLREHGSDEKVTMVTEKQLNQASGGYPHRNEEAYRRTGEKRQVNALDEEMGPAGDASKVDRYEKASKAGPKRLLDKDVGSQLDNPKTKIKNAFNLKSEKKAAIEKSAGAYLEYRQGSTYNRRFAETKKLDEIMAGILEEASGRELNDEEKAKISALKVRKSELLKINA